MSILLSDISKQLPLEDTSDYRRLNKSLFKDLNKTCIVIDDDPTGNQTVYDIPLLTEWNLETIVSELKNKTPVFFLLTNSRSLSQEKSSEIYLEISKNIKKASVITGRDYTIISRSDSTLRGHFSEVEALKQAESFNDSITVFIPVMFEGGRVTINDIHYVSDEEKLTPVNETSFAQDHTFGYSKANLKEWIEEKTKGKVKSSEIFSFCIETIRTLGVKMLCERILELQSGQYCIINALNYDDLNKATQALLLAEKSGKQILYRTSSSFIPSYIGLEPKSLLSADMLVDRKCTTGGLTIVGSYVPKSSAQLEYALNNFKEEAIIEVEVEKILHNNAYSYLASLCIQINKNLESGNDVIVYTSRKLVKGVDVKSNIGIASKISNTLISLVKEMKIQPKYILAKGGITSHDIAIKGLGMKRSKVLGQIEPGIPVWEMGDETKFPKLGYIVFPGNVGNEKSLLKIIQKLS